MVTIFTPAYNRAYTLPRLYQSLCNQVSDEFEWLIVDDGSDDNTQSLIKGYIEEKKVRIRYIKQANGGKHRAINRGVQEAQGKYFFIVDSDDYLTADAVVWINQTISYIDDKEEFAGLSGIRIKPDGHKIGGGSDFGTIDANAIDIRLKHKIAGDLAEVYKTDLLRQFPFPEFGNERFCPEALVWNRIARKYKLHYCHKGIYVCEYQPDGLTAKITRLRKESPKASMTYYSEHFHDNIPIKWKLKAAINFWRFQYCSYRNKYKMLSPLAILGWIPGKFFALLDRNK